MAIKLPIAEIILVAIILLDVSVTVSGINHGLDEGSFWTNPEGAALLEGDPIAAYFIGLGVIFSAGLLIAWILLIVFLYNRGNKFRFFLFGGIFFLHLLAYLTWIVAPVLSFTMIVVIAAVAGIIFGFFVPKTIRSFLDRAISIPI